MRYTREVQRGRPLCFAERPLGGSNPREVATQQDKYRTLFEAAGEGILVASLDTRELLDANPAICRMLGYDSGELTGLRVEDIHPPDTLPQTIAEFEAQARGEKLVAESIPCLRKDGTVFMADIRTTRAVLDGRACNIGFFSDVTARLTMERALRESQERFHELVDLLPIAVYECDLDGRITFTNRIGLQTSRFDDEALAVGVSLFELLPEEDHARAKKNIAATLERGRPSRNEYVARVKDGSSLPIEVHSSPIFVQGRPVGLRGIVIDLTMRKLAEQELRSKHEQLLSVFESIDEVIYVADPDTYEVLFINAALRRLVGDVVGELCYRVFQSLEAPCPFCTNAEIFGANLGNTHTTELRNQRTGRWYRCVDRAIRWPNGRYVRYEMAIDIEQLKEREEERIRAQRLESLGLLAGGIAHDFNNLLMSILGSASLAKHRLGSPERCADHLGNVEKAVEQAKKLTEQLLTFARGGVPVKEVVALAPLIEESVAFSLRGTSVVPEFSLSSDLWLAELDVGQIGQVINNLVLNAVQSMPRGGRLTIHAENVTDVGAPGARAVRISFIDRGQGIPEALLSKVFDPYFTTKETGSGLGLAVVHSIVTQHGGRISATSTLGVGSTFSILLPVAAALQACEGRSSDVALPGTGDILVLDDDPDVLEVVEQMLATLGYTPQGVRDGVEAVALYRERLASAAPFLAVVLDLTVPGGMGGLETLEELRALDPAIRAIVSSGYSNAAIQGDEARHGFAGFVAKPFRLVQLAEVLQRVIKSDGATRGRCTRAPDTTGSSR